MATTDTAITMAKDDEKENYGSIESGTKQQDSCCLLFVSWIFWFIFGGGLIMTIIWYIFAIVATILLIPSPSSINLIKISPTLITPQIRYADCKTIKPGFCIKLSRFFWIIPFGLSLSIIHLIFALIYLPLSFCGISWSSYHIKAMAVSFNPYDKIIINTNKTPFSWYSTSTQILDGVKGLNNKVIIITGCNTGLGKETAKTLYSKGCIVVMACRNQEKANNARNDILQQIKGQNEQNLISIRLDLGDLKTIDEFVAGFQQNEVVNGKLDFLINNAGVMAFPKFGATKDGFERQFGINHMGHFYLVNKLLPIIKQNKTRIINLSSAAHYLFNDVKEMRDWLTVDGDYKGPTEDIVEYNISGFRYYGISKLCNLIFTRHLNKLYNKDGIYSLTLHPGSINTDLARNFEPKCDASVFSLRALWEATKSKSIPQGAATTLRCVTISNEEILNNGGEQLLYFDDCMPRNDKMHGEFMNGENTEIDQLLWDYSCKAIQSLDYLTLNDC